MANIFCKADELYDVIIIGGGAAGLFAGASLPYPVKKGLILEKSGSPGKKVLLSGGGQCNLTHGGPIQDFLSCYGENGKKIRNILYQFNNTALVNFFKQNGIPCFEREDGKVFPQSLRAKDIVNLLLALCKKNGLEIKCSSAVLDIKKLDNSKITSNDAKEVNNHQNINNIKEKHLNEHNYNLINKQSNQNNKNIIHDQLKPDLENKNSENSMVNNQTFYQVFCENQIYLTKKLIVATGGCSYPTTGSDGQMLKILENMGLSITPAKPALVPIYVHNYPYGELSGIAFPQASVTILPDKSKTGEPQPLPKSKKAKERVPTTMGGLLFTHDCFSGPAILNASRYVDGSCRLSVNYLPFCPPHPLMEQIKSQISGNASQVLTFFHEFLNQVVKTLQMDELNTSKVTAGNQVPKRFIEILCQRQNINPQKKASQLTGKEIKDFIGLLTGDTFNISGLGGFNIAMATKGGVCLEEIHTKTMEAKRYPNLFIIGEALDIDGDTGGYNLQFAFSTGHLSANQI